MEVTPSVNRSVPPDFHRLGADTFEEMCCALYQEENGISVAELYRKKYQKQFGIDIRAERADRSGIEVASCKCYSSVRKGQIPQWSQDFLDHWESYWYTRTVQKFVLIVGCDVTAAEREAEIDVEKVKFSKIGVEYEVWGPRSLQSKIRKDAGLVSQFLGPEWVHRLCGTAPLVTSSCPADTGVISASILAQIASLQKSFSGEVEKKLDRAFEDILKGHLDEVAEQLYRIRASHDWIQLLPDVQARVVRLQASIYLQHGDIDRAEALANEADNICLPNEFRLRALIACRQRGPQAGLEKLGTPQTRDGAHLRVGMMLEAGETDEAITFLNTSPFFVEEHAETERLKALAALFRGDRQKAFLSILSAERLKPDWSAIQRTGCIVRYAMALSPMVGSEYYLYPNPIDIELVRDDIEGRTLLSQALNAFDSLSALPDNKERQRMDKLWALACISNLRDSLDEAEKRCMGTLKEDPTNPGAIDWALARGFDLDRHQHKRLLHELLKSGGGCAEHVVTLSRLHIIEDDEKEATEVLELYIDRFNTPSLHETHSLLVHDLLIRQNKLSSDISYEDLDVGHRMALLIEMANRSKDWQDVEELFGELITLEHPPAITLRAAQILASVNIWKNIAKHLDGILRFGTSEAVRIAVYAAFNTGRHKLALQILEEDRAVFPLGLPHELRQLEITALAMTGDQAVALRRADALAAETSDLSDRLLKANLQIRTGNVGGSLAVIREAARENKLSAHSALQLSKVVVLEDIDLARMLWRQSIEKGIPKDLSMPAFHLAHQLGLESEATPLFQMLGELAQEEPSVVKMVHIEELLELQRQWEHSANQIRNVYLKGAMPVHFYTAQTNRTLAEIFQFAKPTEPASNENVLLIRHGGKPANIKMKRDITEWHIHLDITALLLAAQLELLDVLENLPNPLKISAFIPTALLNLESESLEAAQQDERLRSWLTPLRKRVAQGIENGRYVTLPVALVQVSDGGRHCCPIAFKVAPAVGLA